MHMKYPSPERWIRRFSSIVCFTAPLLVLVAAVAAAGRVATPPSESRGHSLQCAKARGRPKYGRLLLRLGVQLHLGLQHHPLPIPADQIYGEKNVPRIILWLGTFMADEIRAFSQILDAVIVMAHLVYYCE